MESMQWYRKPSRKWDDIAITTCQAFVRTPVTAIRPKAISFSQGDLVHPNLRL